MESLAESAIEHRPADHLVMIATHDENVETTCMSCLQEAGYRVGICRDDHALIGILIEEQAHLVILDHDIECKPAIPMASRLCADAQFRALPKFVLTLRAGEFPIWFEDHKTPIDCFLTKPLNPMELTAFVRRALRVVESARVDHTCNFVWPWEHEPVEHAEEHWEAWRKEQPPYGLMEAARFGERERFEWLISKGANPLGVNNWGWSVLHSAAQGGNVEIMQSLLKRGVGADARTQSGSTPLYVAATSGQFDTMRALLKAGANPNITNNAGMNPLMTITAYKGNESHHKWASRAVFLLLENGTDPTITNAEGETALKCARRIGNKLIIESLIAAGAKE